MVFIVTLGLENDNKTVVWVCAIRVMFVIGIALRTECTRMLRGRRSVVLTAQFICLPDDLL